MKLNDLRQRPGISFYFAVYNIPKLCSGLPAVCDCVRHREDKA